MNLPAILMMVTTFAVVTAIAVYFFWRVIRTSPKRGQTEPKSDI